ncbi:class I SAM-dependent methyltransferase [Longimicrobium sp.]|uniref:class I SAM-dependent methyltransferase n=1 Tax=Longimicrobium sp. TaxID=2029185 RepID=UPI002BD95229|nr:methyltransferase domain-containing protein [Longimicrobium sp.]HSU13286.1 methyltransferase domain-containing protein [Longimicrobium sp.]
MATLPAPATIADHYRQVMKDTGGDYIHHRWGASEIQRRHYRQTATALGDALDRLGEPGDVLEIGCGPAVWTPLFLARARSVLLYDISDAMLARARERIAETDGGRHAGKVGYRAGDFVADPPAGESWDTIISVRAFEYMSSKADFVRHCAARLRPGGTLIVVTKNRGWLDMRGIPRATGVPVGVAMHADLRGWREVSGLFRDAGLADVSARPVVFGSYRRPFAWRPGLAAADALHRWRHRRPMARALDPLVESYLVAGRKPVDV